MMVRMVNFISTWWVSSQSTIQGTVVCISPNRQGPCMPVCVRIEMYTLPKGFRVSLTEVWFCTVAMLRLGMNVNVIK